MRPHTLRGGELATGRRIWAAIALACAAWVGTQLVAAAIAGRPMPDPVAALSAADVADAGGAAPTLAPLPAAGLHVRIDLVSAASAPRAVLLRDSVPVARFYGSSVTVAVAPGDLLEVDATAYRQPLTFQVVTAAGLAAPAPGLRVIAHSDIATLGRVRLAP